MIISKGCKSLIEITNFTNVELVRFEIIFRVFFWSWSWSWVINCGMQLSLVKYDFDYRKKLDIDYFIK